jgi:drug/metabolite transporter (DMT)-like permease
VLLQHVSSALSSSYSFVNPIIGLGLGVALGGEVVSSGEALAAGVIAAGVVLLLRAQRRT